MAALSSAARQRGRCLSAAAKEALGILKGSNLIYGIDAESRNTMLHSSWLELTCERKNKKLRQPDGLWAGFGYVTFGSPVMNISMGSNLIYGIDAESKSRNTVLHRS